MGAAAKIPDVKPGATVGDLKLFGEGVVQGVRDGLNITAKDTKGYSYKTVARKVLACMAAPLRLSASGEGWSPWDGLRMEDLMKWMPDEENYLKPLMGLTCIEARRLFAMDPPWISCFACYMGTLSKEQVEVLQKAKHLDILIAIEKFRQSNGHAPSIMTVANSLT